MMVNGKRVIAVLSEHGRQSISQLTSKIPESSGPDIKWVVMSLMRRGTVSMTIDAGVPKYEAANRTAATTASAVTIEGVADGAATRRDIRGEWRRARRRVIRLIELEIEMLDLCQAPIPTGDGTPEHRLAEEVLGYFGDAKRATDNDGDITGPEPTLVTSLLESGAIDESVAVDAAGPPGARRTRAIRLIRQVKQPPGDRDGDEQCR